MIGAANPSLAETLAARSADERLTALVRAEYTFVWRTLRRYGVSAHEAEDLAQRIFLLASQKLDRIEPGRERSFLFSSAVRVANRERRRVALARHDDVDPNETHATELHGEELIEQRRARLLLDQLLEKMGEDLRAVFILYEIEGLTMSEIASLLSLRPGTVASRLRRARQDFATLLEKARTQRSTHGGMP